MPCWPQDAVRTHLKGWRILAQLTVSTVESLLYRHLFIGVFWSIHPLRSLYIPVFSRNSVVVIFRSASLRQKVDFGISVSDVDLVSPPPRTTISPMTFWCFHRAPTLSNDLLVPGKCGSVRCDTMFVHANLSSCYQQSG